MLEIHRWVKVLHLSRASGPVHAFHRHLLRPLHPLWHIHIQAVHPLHRAHPHCHVHQLKWHRQALHSFHHPSLVTLAPLMSIHLEVKQRLMTAAPMALIPILIGKRTKTITTIRKSMAWLFLVAFVNRPSHKNWTLRDVILWNCQWQPCCISRQTTFGFGSWLMGVKSTWFPLGTSQLLCSRRSSWHNSATRGWTWTKSPPAKPGRMGNYWTRPTTPSMQPNRLQILSIAGVPTRAADPDTQHELTQLRSQLAQLRQQLGDTPGDPSSPNITGPSASSPPPIHAALLRSSQSPAPPAPPGFDPSSLLVASTTVNPWIAQNKPTSLAVRAFNKWLKELPISEPKRKVLNDNFAKMEEWWAKQTAEALDTIERVAATMGIPVNLMGKNYEALNLLRTMTAGISLTNWLAPLLRRKLKHKVLQSHLQILQSMILIIYILTPFTMTHSIHLFQGFRIIQTRMMVLTILHGLRPNPKLKSILEGCADLQHLWGTTLHSHNLFSRQFFQPQSVYIRFTHIQNMQPKFYLGSAMHHTLDREYSRSRKYFQLTHERLVQAELALRYWHEHDNLYIWAPIPIYTDRVDYRSLEVALIQEWQPRLNYPFICQFYHPKKGLLKKPLLNTNAQFGLATLWRRAKHKFTPQLVRQVLTSSRFQNRLELWTIVHALGSNTKARFEQTKMLRSNDGGLLLCYALRRLANNTQEPFRTLSLTAIDATIKWWHGKPAPRASALRAPWSLSPNLQSQLKKFLRQWHFQMLDHQVPCHTPSFKTVFIKLFGRPWHPLQSQTGHWRLVDVQSSNMLLQILVRLQNGCTQSFRSSLGIIRFSPPLAASTGTCRDCRRLFIEQSLPVQKGIL